MENGNIEVGPEHLFFRIGQVCRLTDIKPFTLRYWESEFPTLAPVKSSKGHRLYRQEDVQTVLRIKRLLYDEGFTIAGARRYLRDADPGAPHLEAPVQSAPPQAAPPQSALVDMGDQEDHDPEQPSPRDELSAPRAYAVAAGSAVTSDASAARGISRSGEGSAPQPVDAANMLSRKLLLDLRDSLRAFLTLLENE